MFKIVCDSPCKCILETLIFLGWKDDGLKGDSREQTINGVISITPRRQWRHWNGGTSQFGKPFYMTSHNSGMS